MKTEAGVPFPTTDCQVLRARSAGSRFESAWRPDQPLERFDDHLPPLGDPARSYVLCELAVRDLELRLVHDLPARVEDYLNRYPELGDDRAAVLELIRAEYEHRRLTESSLSLDEFRRRFPDHADDLAARVAGLPSVPGYEVLEEIGRGGMGVVYRARQPSLNRQVALKFIQNVEWAQLRQRFRREAEAAAHLQHPNVVQIHAIGEHDGRSYLALEYCAGGSLAERLNGTPWPPDRAAELVETLARAVQFAHDRGIIHRDLKPGNILLAEAGEREAAVSGRRLDNVATIDMDFSVLTPKIADFGLAKKLDDPQRTTTGSVVGTPSYMAPEQASQSFGVVGPAADIYALGAVLYELLTGRPPFKAESKWDTVQQVLCEEPVSPRRFNPKVDRRLETVCLKCLRKEPAGRYGSALALADDLRRFRAGQPVHARPAGLLEHGWRWCRRQPLTAGLSAGLLILALASGAVIVQQWWQAMALVREERAARQQAEDNFAIARQLVSELAQVGTTPLTAEFDAQREQQRQALLKAESYCRRLLQDPQASAEVRMTLAQVYEGLSGLYRSLGDLQEAEQASIRAVAEWQRLVDEDDNPTSARGLTRARRLLALQYAHKGNLLLALNVLRQAQAHLQSRVAADFVVQMEISDLKFDLASCLEETGERVEAQALFAENHALLTQLLHAGHSPPELRPRLAATCLNEGTLLELLGRPREALPYWQQARTLYQDLVAEGPHPRLTFRLAQCCASLARNRAGSATDYTEALRLLEDASRQLDHLAVQDPAVVGELGDTYYFLALWNQSAGEDHPALAACQIGVRHSETAMRRHPLDPDCAGRWLRALGLLSRLQDRAGHAADAAVTRQQLKAGILQLTRVASEQHRSRLLVAWQLAKLSPDMRQTGNWAEALEAAQACRRLYDELVAETPSDASLQAGLANAWVQVAKCYWRLEDYEQVLQACRYALDVQRQLFEQAPQVLEYRALLDDRHVRLERILGHMGRLDEVRDSILEREKLWMGNPARLRTLAEALNKLADEALALRPQDPRTEGYRDEAARLVRRADGLDR